MKPLPSNVAIIVADLLLLLDRHLPGSVEGLYLVGSIALDDYHPGQSDIDFIAIAAPGADLSPLSAVHAELAARHRAIHCDGIYLTRGELAAPPSGVGPSAREGLVSIAADERHAITWLTLLEHGIAVRGPEPHADWIATNREAAVAYSRENLHAYWRPWLNRRRRLLDADGLSLLTGKAAVWAALGVARLHAAITTGAILSKTAAGHQALESFPAHASIVREALRLRSGATNPVYRSPFTRRRDLIAFMDAVIDFET